MPGLVRHHPVIRHLAKPAVAASATATLGLNILVFESLREGSLLGVDRHGFLELVILLGGLYVLFLGEVGHRSTNWTRSLPLEAKTLRVAHQRALVLAFSVVMGLMALVMAGFAQLLQLLRETDIPGAGEVLVHFVRPWLMLLALAVILGGWRADLADPHQAPHWNRVRWGLGVGALMALALLQPLSLVAALAPVSLAVAWARRSGLRLAPVLTLAEREGKTREDHVSDRGTHGRLVRHLVVARLLFKWPMTWIVGLPMVFLLGMIQGGGLGDVTDGDFARFFNVWISIYILVAFVGHFLDRLHLVDHLPVSRRFLLGWLLLPAVAILMIGGLVGRVIEEGMVGGESLAFREDPCCGELGLLVPTDLWLPAWGAPVEKVTSPWGEAHEMVSVHVLGPLHLYKPYTTRKESSADFVAWQIVRAAEAAHGVILDDGMVKDRYLVTADDGQVGVREGGLTLVEDGHVQPRGSVGPLLPMLAGFTIVGALVTCSGIFLMCGPGATRRRTKSAFWGAMGILMVLHLGGYGLLMTRTIEDWHVAALINGLAGRLGGLGIQGWGLAWAGAVLAGIGAYLLCGRAFARVEAVRGGSSCPS